MVTRLFSQLVSQRQSEGYGLAMLGIAGGLGLSALFKGVRL
ncbi:3-ketoacyl-CoA thiolase [Erwinia amylovora Ea644]|nr:3-ketoacyl-CoA thiolase [Erwinia amylovora Ea644]